MSHIPVLLAEVVENIIGATDSPLVLDGTFGCGGHSSAIVGLLSQRYNCNGLQMICGDRDLESIDIYRKLSEKWNTLGVQTLPVHSKFSEWSSKLPPVIPPSRLVSSILIDIGVSSMQLDDGSRGFSFLHNHMLDMRMDKSSGVSAKEFIANASLHEIAEVIYRYGEEKDAWAIADAIGEARKRGSLNTTGELAELVSSVKGGRKGKRHPATKCFQAIRIAINNELQELSSGLESARDLLPEGGRLLVITFQGLEVRVLRDKMRQPLLSSSFRLLDKIRPSRPEVLRNRRSRSASLFVFERLPRVVDDKTLNGGLGY